ncbi:MAG: universal stress protein [Dehalococcoidia bacterium]
MEFGTIKLKTILVPVDGSQASMDALSLACLLAKRNKGKVYAVYVIEVARTLPLDADLNPEAQEGEQILARAEQVADSLDYEVTGELLQARDAGHAIVDEAIERDVDAIVAGIEYKRTLGEFQMGQTAQYVLRNASCQVIVCRSAVGSGGA